MKRWLASCHWQHGTLNGFANVEFISKQRPSTAHIMSEFRVQKELASINCSIVLLALSEVGE